MNEAWTAGIAAFAFVVLMVPVATWTWRITGRRDAEVSLRKVHTNETPRIGGIVILLGVSALWAWLASTILQGTETESGPVIGAVAGAAACGLIGVYDDLFGLGARRKLLLQFLAAALAIALGLKWPPVDFLFDRNWASMAVTAMFLVACANAFNFLDGIDGLATGVAGIGFTVLILAVVASPEPSIPLWMISAVALGASLGFLWHNRHPARAFLGDGGAYFLGFLLAALVMLVEPLRPRTYIVRISIPFMVLALPLLDLGLTILRRLVRGQPLFTGDADHIHHRLLARGFSHISVTGILWLVAAIFAGMGLLGVLGVDGTWTLTGTILTVAFLIRALGYQRMFLVRRGLGSNDDRTWLERRRELIQLLDAVENLGQAARDHGVVRWRRLSPDLERVLRQMGIGAFQIRTGDGEVVVGTTDAQPRAWLDLPLDGDGELRLGLGGGLVGLLRPEQQVALERLVAVVGGFPAGPRAKSSHLGPPHPSDSNP